jgi:BASS family bile acid:Na+ symporter
MDLKQIVLLAVQISILATVFSIGLRATFDDLLYLVRRPGLLLRSLLAVFVIMPLVALTLIRLYNFRQTVEIALMALSISPVPPLLPQKETAAGGHAAYGVGLMAFLSLFAIVVDPVSVELMQRFFGRQLALAPGAITGVVVKSALAPLVAGMIVRAALPALAAGLEKPVAMLGKVLLVLSVLVLLVAASPAMWALVGNGTLLGLVIFTLAGIAIGHILGGPDQEHSVVLALSTACRHPAIALTIASANFPDRHFGATILLYLIVNGLAGIPYVMWARRQMVPAVR